MLKLPIEQCLDNLSAKMEDIKAKLDAFEGDDIKEEMTKLRQIIREKVSFGCFKCFTGRPYSANGVKYASC